MIKVILEDKKVFSHESQNAQKTYFVYEQNKTIKDNVKSEKIRLIFRKGIQIPDGSLLDITGYLKPLYDRNEQFKQWYIFVDEYCINERK